MFSNGDSQPVLRCRLPLLVVALLVSATAFLGPQQLLAQEVVGERNGWKVLNDFQPTDLEIDHNAICTLPQVEDVSRTTVDPMGVREADGMAATRVVGQTAEFDIEYIGFEGVEGENARDAFERAAEIWGSHIASNVPITVQAIFEEEEEEGVLASAGPGRFYSAPIEGPRGEERRTFFPVAIANNLAGEDLEASHDDPVAHIRVRINADIDWYYGEATPGSNEFDFVTIVLHELGHGLGFVGSMTVDEDENEGLYPFSRESQEEFGDPLIYDRFVRDGRGDWLTDESDYPNPSRRLANALQGQRDGLFFEGDRTLEANVFEPARLYTPPEWNPGSSYSHLDEGTYPSDDVNSLMTPRIAREEVIQSPGAITCGIFADMFWQMGPGCTLLIEEDLLAFGAEADAEQPGGAIVEWVIERGGDVANMTLERMYRDAPPPLREFVEEVTIDADDLDHPTLVDFDDDRQIYRFELSELPAGRHVFRLRVERLDGTEFFSQEEEVTIELVDEEIAIRSPYPNPATDFARFDVTLARGQIIDFYLYDSSGRVVQREQVNARANVPETFEIRASNLASGVYHARVIGRDFDESRQLVIVR